MPATYVPTNPGWGAAATFAKRKKKKRVPAPGPGLGFGPIAQNPGAGAPGAPQAQSNPYAGLLSSYMNQQRADFGAQSVADAASRDAAIKRFLISYGEVPDFATMGLSDAAKAVLGGLGGDIRALAAKNTAEGTSIKARLDQANALQQRRIPAGLAGRGLLRSGQTGADLNAQAMSNKQANFDVLNEMLGNIEGTVSQFAQAEAARARALADAELQASMAAFGDYGGEMYGDYGDAGGGFAPQAAAAAAGRPAVRRKPAKRAVFRPTNPGWGAAATYAKRKGRR